MNLLSHLANGLQKTTAATTERRALYHNFTSPTNIAATLVKAKELTVEIAAWELKADPNYSTQYPSQHSTRDGRHSLGGTGKACGG